MLGMNNTEYWRAAAAEERKKNRELILEIVALRAKIGMLEEELSQMDKNNDALTREVVQARKWSAAWKRAAKHFSMFDDLFGQQPDCDLREKQP